MIITQWNESINDFESIEVPDPPKSEPPVQVSSNQGNQNQDQDQNQNQQQSSNQNQDKDSNLEYWDANVAGGVWRKTEMGKGEIKTANETTPMIYRKDGVILEKPEKLKGFLGNESDYESNLPANLPPELKKKLITASSSASTDDEVIKAYKEAIKYDNDIRTGKLAAPLEFNWGEQDSAIESIKTKLEALENADAIEKSYKDANIPIPNNVKKELDTLRAQARFAYSTMSKTDKGYETKTDVRSAIVVGIGESTLEKLGISRDAITGVKSEIKQQNENRIKYAEELDAWNKSVANLKDYKTKEGYNIDKALKAGLVNDVSRLFKKEDVEAAQLRLGMTAASPYLNKSKVGLSASELSKYGVSEKEQERINSMQKGFGQISLGMAITPNGLVKAKPVAPIYEQYLANRIQPKTSEADFTGINWKVYGTKEQAAEFFLTNREGLPDPQVYKNWSKKAREEFNEKYGELAREKSAAITLASSFVQPARALEPSTQFEDIKGWEWGLGAFQAGLLAFSLKTPVKNAIPTKAGFKAFMEKPVFGFGETTSTIIPKENVNIASNIKASNIQLSRRLSKEVVGGRVYGLGMEETSLDIAKAKGIEFSGGKIDKTPGITFWENVPEQGIANYSGKLDVRTGISYPKIQARYIPTGGTGTGMGAVTIEAPATHTVSISSLPKSSYAHWKSILSSETPMPIGMNVIKATLATPAAVVPRVAAATGIAGISILSPAAIGATAQAQININSSIQTINTMHQQNMITSQQQNQINSQIQKVNQQLQQSQISQPEANKLINDSIENNLNATQRTQFSNIIANQNSIQQTNQLNQQSQTNLQEAQNNITTSQINQTSTTINQNTSIIPNPILPKPNIPYIPTPKKIIPINTPKPPKISSSFGGGLSRGNTRKYYAQFFEIPEMYVALPKGLEIKPSKMGKKLWGKMLEQPSGVELTEDLSFEDLPGESTSVETPFGTKKNVKIISKRVKLSSGASEYSNRYRGKSLPPNNLVNNI